jgi:MFS family permease
MRSAKHLARHLQWGQLANVFGRYIALQASLAFMIFGSALCAGAPVNDFPMLLAGRGLEGVGSSGLMIMIDIILADKVSLSENAKNNTIFTLVHG